MFFCSIWWAHDTSIGLNLFVTWLIINIHSSVNVQSSPFLLLQNSCGDPVAYGKSPFWTVKVSDNNCQVVRDDGNPSEAGCLCFLSCSAFVFCAFVHSPNHGVYPECLWSASPAQTGQQCPSSWVSWHPGTEISTYVLSCCSSLGQVLQ